MSRGRGVGAGRLVKRWGRCTCADAWPYKMGRRGAPHLAAGRSMYQRSNRTHVQVSLCERTCTRSRAFCVRCLGGACGQRPGSAGGSRAASACRCGRRARTHTHACAARARCRRPLRPMSWSQPRHVRACDPRRTRHHPSALPACLARAHRGPPCKRPSRLLMRARRASSHARFGLNVGDDVLGVAGNERSGGGAHLGRLPRGAEARESAGQRALHLGQRGPRGLRRRRQRAGDATRRRAGRHTAMHRCRRRGQHVALDRRQGFGYARAGGHRREFAAGGRARRRRAAVGRRAVSGPPGGRYRPLGANARPGGAARSAGQLAHCKLHICGVARRAAAGGDARRDASRRDARWRMRRAARRASGGSGGGGTTARQAQLSGIVDRQLALHGL
mmetsp:Transcript_14478/g.42167  ORF Transcript_14478/g.42167 Transcript_14478/m.42167 type:complete len:390 (-) Transcript_14478:240-1409(-)